MKKLKVVHNWIFPLYCPELPIWPKIENSYQKLVWGTLCFIYFVLLTVDTESFDVHVLTHQTWNSLTFFAPTFQNFASKVIMRQLLWVILAWNLPSLDQHIFFALNVLSLGWCHSKFKIICISNCYMLYQNVTIAVHTMKVRVKPYFGFWWISDDATSCSFYFN